ncbi:spore germination protein [Paenibacillus sp. MER TA 81-3]|uniref:spore germination protein n=1 Tax=Paenibacillus sp. MER TA 81-3 TaxID=2939573 RepID=UPI00203E4BAE|nr:spore germination protein [Paenibacillus sp. MER TA 81-3]MCM3342420.1 spore germination protein [Paenibacillus sp. MER TA 81-3]
MDNDKNKTKISSMNDNNLPIENDNHTIEKYLHHSFKHTQDLTVQRIEENGTSVLIAYLDTIADHNKLQRIVFQTFLKMPLNEINTGKQTCVNYKVLREMAEAKEELLKGSCIISIEGTKQLYAINIANDVMRSIAEPENEKVVQGSHEGFIETLRQNVYLIRKTLKSDDLIIQYDKVGDEVQTEIALVYLEKHSNKRVINEIKRRLKSKPIDCVVNIGQLEGLIEDSTRSPFPQMLNTERVDRTIAHLNEGKIIIFLEGCSTCLIAPVHFSAFLQSADDYSSRWITRLFISSLRFMGIFVAVFLPAFYIAVIAFHFDVLPDELVMPIKNSINEIPFPPLIEAFIMELTIELIREAGLRLPPRIGPTVSIVGGLVIGDAIVRAGLISTTMIIVVAITAIAAFSIPTHEMSEAVRLLRFPFMLLAACLGLVGMAFGVIAVLGHLCKLESFGSPYFTPFTLKDFKDKIIGKYIKKLIKTNT